jgi:hypothetical protein
MTRDDALALDAADPLAPLREQFELPPGVIYLDGNSLGVLPRATAARVQAGGAAGVGPGADPQLERAGWITLPQRVGDKIARLVGVGAGELVVADSTSVNLFKVLSAALNIVAADAPERRCIVSERSNFPTDLYIAESLAKERGFELVLCEADQLPAQLDQRAAVLMLTHVNYRSGRMHDMAALSRAAHAAGALTVWDLAHSAGAVPLALPATAPTSPSAAATSTSTAVPAHRPSSGRTRAMQNASGSRWPAGWVTPPPSSSRPATVRPPASRATCAARRRCCRWPRWNAVSTRCWPPGRWAAWRPCAPSRWH